MGSDPTPIGDVLRQGVDTSTMVRKLKQELRKAIVRDVRLTPSQKAVGVLFVDFAKATEAGGLLSWVTYERLHTDTGSNRKTIVAAIRRLRELGYLHQQAGPHRGRAPVHSLHMVDGPRVGDRLAYAGRGRKPRVATPDGDGGPPADPPRKEPSYIDVRDPAISGDDHAKEPNYFPQRSPSISGKEPNYWAPSSQEVSRRGSTRDARATAAAGAAVARRYDECDTCGRPTRPGTTRCAPCAGVSADAAADALPDRKPPGMKRRDWDRLRSEARWAATVGRPSALAGAAP